MSEQELTPEEEADMERRALAQAACATAIGFNQMAIDAKTLGEKVYARECRKAWVDEAKKLGVELRFGNHGAEPPTALILAVPGGGMWIKFREDDIELMRACVAEHDAKRAKP